MSDKTIFGFPFNDILKTTNTSEVTFLTSHCLECGGTAYFWAGNGHVVCWKNHVWKPAAEDKP